jgi:exonuclease III
MTSDRSQAPRLRIWQQNLNKNLGAQHDVLHSADPQKFDIIALQELHIDFLGRTRANPHWYVIYPTDHLQNQKATRSVILVNKKSATSSWAQIAVQSQDVTALKISGKGVEISLYNIYNDCNHSAALEAATQAMRRTRTDTQEHTSELIWLGDFNRHHPLWDEERNAHLFTATNLDKAQALLNMLATYDMRMALAKDIPTLEAKHTKNHTCPDNVFCSANLLQAITKCTTTPEARAAGTDHYPILTTIDEEVLTTSANPRRNFRMVDWSDFGSALRTRLALLPAWTKPRTQEELEDRADNLAKAITATIEEKVPLSKPCPHSKRWWAQELATEKAKMHRLARLAYPLRNDPSHPIHTHHRHQRNKYAELLKHTKQEHWNTWLEEMTERDLWDASRLVSGVGNME